MEIARGELSAADYSGDAHDVFVQRAPSERAWIWLSDASGVDFDAARIALQARACVRSHGLQGASPREVLARTNLALYQLGPAASFLSAVLVCWEPERGVLTWSSAGCEVLLVYRAADQRTELVKAGGIVLGVIGADAESGFHDHELRLGPGDALLLATDGLSELRRPNDRLVSLETVGAAVSASARGASASELAESLLEWIDQERAGEPLEDDLTFVVVKAAPRAG